MCIVGIHIFDQIMNNNIIPFSVPIIVAINKVDKPEADIVSTLLHWFRDMSFQILV